MTPACIGSFRFSFAQGMFIFRSMTPRLLFTFVACVLLCFTFAGHGQQPLSFQGAPPAGQPPKPSPLTGEEEQGAFTLAPGFEIELVAAEPDAPKVVTVVFD